MNLDELDICSEWQIPSLVQTGVSAEVQDASNKLDLLVRTKQGSIDSNRIESIRKQAYLLENDVVYSRRKWECRVDSWVLRRRDDGGGYHPRDVDEQSGGTR